MGCPQSLAFIPAVLIAAVSLTISPSYGVIHDDLVTICSKTSPLSRCQKILENDPRTTSADLPKLSLVSIEIMMKQAKLNFESFSKLSPNSTDPVLKKAFKHCLASYHEMQSNIQEAYRLSQQRKYNENTALVESEKLAERRARGIQINLLPIDDINKLMI